MASNMQIGRLHWIEQFDGGFDTTNFVAGRCTYLIADGTTFGVLAINGGAGRIAIATDVGDALAVYGPLAFEPDECTVAAMQVRIRNSDHSVASVFVGFTDALSDSVIIEDEDGTLNTIATDAFGILMEAETVADAERWQTIGVQNNTDNAQALVGSATDDVNVPANTVDSNWETIRIEGTAANSGTMRVYLEDGNSNLGLVATRTSFLDSSIVYAPVVSADGRDSAYNVDIAEFGWDGGHGAYFD